MPRGFRTLPLSPTSILAHTASDRHFAPHEDLFLQGDEAHELYTILSGHVKLWRPREDGTATAILMLGAGEILGSVAVAQGIPQLTCATATENTQVLGWGAEAFRAELRTDPDLAGAFLQAVARRAGQLLDRIEDVAGLPVEQRLARLLLRLAGEHGRHDDSLAIGVQVRQQDLAELASTTVPTVSRCLSGWVRDGMIVKRRGGVIITQLSQIAALAGVHLD